MESFSKYLTTKNNNIVCNSHDTINYGVQPIIIPSFIQYNIRPRITDMTSHRQVTDKHNTSQKYK